MPAHPIPVLLTIIALFSFTGAALGGEIRISAATSLREAVNEISDSFTKRNPGVKFLKNYAASGILAKQIENGASVDIFISANAKWMEYLNGKKLVNADSIIKLCGNSLVFVGTTDKELSSIQDVPKLQRVAIGSPNSVPAGEYASQAIRNSGLENLLAKKIVLARDVRECLLYAERGEVDGAFVYRSDTLQARQTRILFTVPQELYSPVYYPMALTIRGTNNGDANSFYNFLQNGEAKAILLKFGFTIR